jgi:hypothetical protein
MLSLDLIQIAYQYRNIIVKQTAHLYVAQNSRPTLQNTLDMSVIREIPAFKLNSQPADCSQAFSVVFYVCFIFNYRLFDICVIICTQPAPRGGFSHNNSFRTSYTFDEESHIRRIKLQCILTELL